MERGQKNEKILFLQNWVIDAREHVRASVGEIVQAVQATIRPSAERAFDFRVVASELINNEFVHGNGEAVRVRLSAYDSGYAELCVHGSNGGFDVGEELEKRKGRGDTWREESGRGLVLAAALCETLGSELIGNERVVCARICLED